MFTINDCNAESMTDIGSISNPIEIRSCFTIYSTIEIKQNSNILKIKIIDDLLIEIDSYPKETGIMIGDLSNIENYIIYIVVFDKHIIILDENELRQIINKTRNRFQFYFLNSKCMHKIEEMKLKQFLSKKQKKLF